jgi:hypothetical protein
MEGKWVLEAEVGLSNRTMEESIIETFGCVAADDKAIRIYVSNDGRVLKTDFCMNGTVIDSRMMNLPAMPCAFSNGATVGLAA